MHTLKVSLINEDDGTVVFYDEVQPVQLSEVTLPGCNRPTMAGVAALLTRLVRRQG